MKNRKAPRRRARNLLLRHGYAVDGHVKETTAGVARQHKRHEGKGKKLTKVLRRSGGTADGAQARYRADKPRRTGGRLVRRAGSSVPKSTLTGGMAPRRQDGGDAQGVGVASDAGSGDMNPAPTRSDLVPPSQPASRLHEDGLDFGAPDTVARYPDGSPIVDSTGKPMVKPPFADTALALQRALPIRPEHFPAAERDFKPMAQHSGALDFQRIPGHEPNNSYQDYSNYIYGAAAAAAGFGASEMEAAGRLYSFFRSQWSSERPFGTPTQNVEMWHKGYNDYQAGKLGFDK